MTTKRFAGVSFADRGAEFAFTFAPAVAFVLVLALLRVFVVVPEVGVALWVVAWRRADCGFGRGVAGDAMKRCGEGFWGGILGETLEL